MCSKVFLWYIQESQAGSGFYGVHTGKILAVSKQVLDGGLNAGQALSLNAHHYNECEFSSGH